MNYTQTHKQLKVTTYFLLFTIVSFFYYLSKPMTVFAGGGCDSVGQCINDTHCTQADVNGGSSPTGGPCGGTEIIGGVAPPEALSGLVGAGAAGSNGLVFFISRLINFGTIIAGIITVGNFIAAGVMYVSAGSTGDSGIHVKVRDKLTYGITGLVIIIASYTIIGLVGLIFFGNPAIMLNPKLTGL